MREIVRQRVLYSGHVQGVCFRATAAELARRRPVVGWVRNRPDGTVELEAEGAPGEVAAFLDAVARHFERNITAAARTALPPRGDETGFEIRY